MDEQDILAGRFAEHRARLRAIAMRMLGSDSEADDALQEAWLRVNRAGADDVENLAGWLTTIVARVCLNMLQSRRFRREEPLGEYEPVPIRAVDPQQEAVLADSVGLALLVVLETLAPAERLAFVLHDMFAVPFDEIAPIVDRTPAAARQLASRARRRVQNTSAVPDADPGRHRQIAAAFLAASRGGDFTALLAMLDPDVVLRSDSASVAMGADAFVRGATGVASTFAGRAEGARPALIDGSAGAVWSVRGKPKVVFAFTVTDGRIAAIELVADELTLEELDITLV